MIRFSKNSKKAIVTFFLLVEAVQIIAPTSAMALTSGPTQPEVQAFQPAGNTEMVDLFSGDFGYNIPMFELPGPNGGYPFNLSYQAGMTMDQEASWVGLGWSLNPGAINRSMRGLPDEFKGDDIYTKTSVDNDVTAGLGLGVGAEFAGAGLQVGMGFSVNNNSYRGVGYAIDGNLGFGKAIGSGMTAGIGLNFSLDSREGVSASPSLGLGTKAGDVGLSANYNSKRGLSSVSLSYDPPRNIGIIYKNNTDKPDKDFKAETIIDLKSSATLSLANPGYTPQISMPMENYSISATFKIGTAWYTIYPDAYVTGFYSEQKLANKDKWVKSDGYGYSNFQHRTSRADLIDFNREKDGMVSKDIPNLGIPSLTYDIYSVAGQGISSMYRPMRNDIGVVHDPTTESKSIGGSAGVDVAIPPHIGVNLAVNHSRSHSGVWDENNMMLSRLPFEKQKLNELYEPVYFKSHGEHTSEDNDYLNAIGQTDAVRVKAADMSTRENVVATPVLENGRGWGAEVPDAKTSNLERKQRNEVILPLTNEELVAGNQELVSLFKVRYLDSAGVERNFERGSLPQHHTAGFTALNSEGLRYVYAIPAYNTMQEDVTFSAEKAINDTTTRVPVCDGCDKSKGDPKYKRNGTDKYLKRTQLPAYAHAYLLTSIVGPDYVDLTGNGVSDDDLGYWVKFTYRKSTDKAGYQWRDPYSKAHLQEGWKTDPRDDKGSFAYGKRETWYLAKAETKSHVATFTVEPRTDARGVFEKLQDSDAQKGAYSYALKEIKLFTRVAGATVPLKVIKFQYDYSLCKGVYNGAPNSGKLTLKKVWFEYGNSTRGQANPYVFHYNEENALENPNYSLYNYDRWGTYKPSPKGDLLRNIDAPYCDQDPGKKDIIDRNAAVWNLKRIELPSGGEVMIDYETDDYGYVQHKRAMQMTEIINPAGDTGATSFIIDDNNLKVKFRLEKPEPAGLTDAEKRQRVLEYIDKERQLHFKLLMNVRSDSENFFEYISGYADIDIDKPNGIGLETDGSSEYVYGFFYLKAEKGRHPFSLRAWQHLRTNQPDLANDGKRLQPATSTSGRVNQIKGLGSIGDQVRQMFKGFNEFCDDRHWGREIVAGKSWVRLNSPDYTKYGGGSRVRQITLKEDWGNDEEGIYGQVYEYTTTHEDGRTISSGVAAYEPLVGGEENALRYAKRWSQSVPLRSDNNFFFEYPVNENYFPGPHVGYRKVTVSSLAAANLAGKDVKNIVLSDGQKLYPSGPGISYGTSGMTVHEFYTAKDFPVITDETDKYDRQFQRAYSIPFLGNISTSKLVSTQGYSIVTNDMHGKPLQVTNYRQNTEGVVDLSAPISWVRYNYAHDTVFYQNTKVLKVRNQFVKEQDGTLSMASAAQLANQQLKKYAVGQENEFFVDMREYEDNTYGGGANYNTDFVYLLFGLFPVPTSWPNIGKTKNLLRTSVANKVIFQSGILQTTEAYDGGSHVITNNERWDAQTGAVILSSVNNNFDDKVYTYTMLAYHEYQGMGAAYQNIGLRFDITNIDNLPYHNNMYQFTSPIDKSVLAPGDEILLYNDDTFKQPVARVVYAGEENDEHLMYCATSLPAFAYKAMIVRSGYRNQLSASAGSITALDNPLVQGQTVSYPKSIKVPKQN